MGDEAGRLAPGAAVEHRQVGAAAGVGDTEFVGCPGGEHLAADVEPATGRDPRRVRRLALEHHRATTLGQERQQGMGVGVLGDGEDLVDRAGLDDPAEVHHGHPVGDVPREPEVVRDDQRGEAEVVAQPEQQRQDLAPHRGVERGHRFVGDEERRLEDERPDDDDPLALAAGELVGVAEEVALGRPEPGAGQRVGHPLALVGDLAVDPQALGDRVVDGVPRVERTTRVLVPPSRHPRSTAQLGDLAKRRQFVSCVAAEAKTEAGALGGASAISNNVTLGGWYRPAAATRRSRTSAFDGALAGILASLTDMSDSRLQA